MPDEAGSNSKLLIPGYQITELIGRGGMASVYLAIQESLGREVALKVMAPQFTGDENFTNRFVKEGRIIARLSHPHIVTIYDIGFKEGHYYMAMEYIGGGTVKEQLAQGMSLDDCLVVIQQIGSALGYAHQHDFIHRDVKPANILKRYPGAYVLSDFGIAKGSNVAGATHMEATATGVAMGTPHFMSPEQASGKGVTNRSDIYSLGVVLYEMLTGEKPYNGPDPFSVALKHLNDPVPTLPEQFAEVQPVLDRMMAKNPDERYATAEEMVQEIGMLRMRLMANSQDTMTAPVPSMTPGGSTIPTMPFGPNGPRTGPVPIKPQKSGSKTGLIIGALVLLGALAGGGYWWYSQQGQTPVTPREPIASINPPKSEPEPQPAKTDEKPANTETKPPVSTQPEEPPAPTPPALSAETQGRIQRLLEIGDLHLSIDRLTEYPGSDAYYAYTTVLSLDSDNAKAKQGLQRIANRYVELAQEQMDAGERDFAAELVERGLGVVPTDAELKRLRKQLSGPR